MRLYKRCEAKTFGVEDTVDETRRNWRERRGPERIEFKEPARLSLFEDWRELSTSPIYQQHRLTEAATEILEEGTYGLGKDAVKALLAERIYEEKGKERYEPVGIAIKLPSTKEIRRRAGLLVYAYADEPDQARRVLEGGLGFQPVPAPGGLYMTDTLRVLSLTRFHARLCLTGRIEQACSWGAYDRLTGGDDRPAATEDVDALGTLAP
ncbi:hypothetical protein MMB17_05545 [Methylobacterium organophilum]|uniref:hypothetical protein n=1 Tax=Methylobacterium organophilum TaxID=410 RepID=UPI001F12DDA1|nr:hypothetical protein [Methylobacterium organophilum]UMY18780.1 hypothetical protein MMB17_05545 [Methylobacterium organophilum]